MISDSYFDMTHGDFPAADEEITNEQAETLCKELCGKVEFDHGDIFHKSFGSIHVKGEFPRIKPRNSRETIAPEDLNFQKTKLAHWVESIFNIQKDPKYFDELISVTVVLAAYTNPFDAIESTQMFLIMKTILVYWHLDDVLEQAIDRLNIPLSVIQAGTQQILQILKGKQEPFVEVQGFPIFKPLFDAFVNIYESFSSHIPNFGDISWPLYYFRQRYFDTMQWYAVDKIESSYSEDTFKYFLRLVKLVDELGIVIYLAHGYCLPKNVAKSPSLRRMMDITNTYCGHANDLLGLKKEFIYEQKDNIVVYKVLRNGSSLEGAVAEMCELQKSELTDFIRLRDATLRHYSHEKNLLAFIDTLESVMDGHNQMYQHSRRHLCDGSVKLSR